MTPQRPSFKRWIWISSGWLLFAAILLAVFHTQIFFFLGSILVNAQPPEKADIVVVIGGDLLGNRILKGAELVRQGYAPLVLASGSGSIYGHFESDLAVDFAEHHGYPAGLFVSFHEPALSTQEEARRVIAELRRRGVHRYLLVTSDYHTARAGRIFRREGSGLEMRTVAAPDPYWAGGRWWTNREGQKIWLYETMKTIGNFFGL